MPTLSAHLAIIKSDKRRRFTILNTIVSWAAPMFSHLEKELDPAGTITLNATKLIIVRTEKPLKATVTVGAETLTEIDVDGLWIFTAASTVIIKNANAVGSPAIKFYASYV